MCLPLVAGALAATGALTGAGAAAATTALTGLQLASTVVGGIMQSRVAGQTAQAQADAASSQYRAQMGQLDEQYRQVNNKAAQEESAVMAQARRERATLDASSAEAGFSGGVLDRLARQINYKASDDLSTVETNRYNQQAQIYRGAEGMRAQAQSSINQAQAEYRRNRTNWVGTAFQLGNTLLDGGMKLSTLGTPRSPLNK